MDGTPFWVECKNRKVHGPLAQYMDQAKAATDGRPPVVICHRLGTSTDTDTVTMLGSEFFAFAIGLGLPAVTNILVTISLLDFESLCKGTR